MRLELWRVRCVSSELQRKNIGLCYELIITFIVSGYKAFFEYGQMVVVEEGFCWTLKLRKYQARTLLLLAIFSRRPLRMNSFKVYEDPETFSDRSQVEIYIK